MAIEIVASNPSKFNKEFRKATIILKSLNAYKIVLNVVSHLYPRYYLVDDYKIASTATNDIIFGGDREIINFTKNEIKVMKILRENPCMRISAISNSCSLHPRTVVSVLKSLKNRNIILGFKSMIDTEKLNILSLTLQHLFYSQILFDRRSFLSNFAQNCYVIA